MAPHSFCKTSPGVNPGPPTSLHQQPQQNQGARTTQIVQSYPSLTIIPNYDIMAMTMATMTMMLTTMDTTMMTPRMTMHISLKYLVSPPASMNLSPQPTTIPLGPFQYGPQNPKDPPLPAAPWCMTIPSDNNPSLTQIHHDHRTPSTTANKTQQSHNPKHYK